MTTVERLKRDVDWLAANIQLQRNEGQPVLTTKWESAMALLSSLNQSLAELSGGVIVPTQPKEIDHPESGGANPTPAPAITELEKARAEAVAQMKAVTEKFLQMIGQPPSVTAAAPLPQASQ